jgi:membrane protease YdiL (CAAX protease family)
MARPTLRSANALLLIVMLLILIPGSLIQGFNLPWGLVISELFMILLPALLILRRWGLPAAETLRLRWPGARPLLLAALMGLGTFGTAAILGTLMSQWLGYEPPAPEMPTTPGPALVMLIAAVVLAPLCEETFFRGYLFHVYLQKGARVAMTAIAVLFALFHLRLVGLPALLPVAFLLSFVRWRSDSLLPGIALHFTHNLLASLDDLVSTVTGHSLPISDWMVYAGILVGAVALVLFARTVRRAPAPVEAEPAPVVLEVEPPAADLGALEAAVTVEMDALPVTAPAPVAAERFWSYAWPLAVILGIYILSAALEVFAGTHPSLFTK